MSTSNTGPDQSTNGTPAYQVFLEVKDMPHEYDHLQVRLRLEQSRFIIWAQELGLVSEILEEPSRILRLNRNLVLDVLVDIQSAFQTCLEISSKFEATAHPIVATTPIAAIEGSGGGYQNFIRKALSLRDKSLRGKARLHWALISKDSFEKLIGKLVLHNDTVDGLLSQHTLQMVSERQNLMVLQTTETLAGVRLLLQALKLDTQDAGVSDAHATRALDPLPSLTNLAEFRARQLQIEEAPGARNTRLTVDQLTLTEAGKEASRQYAIFEVTPVWIEWRDIQQATLADSEVQRLYETRADKLASILTGPDKPKAFRTPDCLGHVFQPDRYGLVYRMPSTICRSLVSLRQLFAEKPRASLGTRIRIAVMLVESLLYLHAVNWVHKGIRSDSVLFEPAKIDRVSDLDLVLSGFEFARPDLPDEMTVKHDMPQEHDLYRHPDLLIQAPGRSTKLHDVYSMGLVLAEIALWQPIETIVDIELRRSQLNNVRGRMLEPQRDVFGAIAFQAGESYAEAVATCIRGFDGVGNPHAEQGTAEQIEIQRMFLESVVERLRRLTL